jgi:hypothetical protein
VNRKAVVIALAIAALVGAAYFVITLSRPAPAPVETAEGPPPAPLVAPEPAPEPLAPEPPPPAPAARPRSAPRSAPAPAPAEASAVAGAVQIASDVPGAQVFVNRAFVGEAPVIVPNLEPGSYQINVSAKGYESIARTVEVTSGPVDVLVKFREVRLDARIDVVHKHRFGSCRGRLIATAQGLRYDTTDKNDAFSAALLDLDVFVVDYLDKNLRIQARKGRRFDFTDPEEDADRLFVFHRDVEKARDQLRKGDPPATP